MSMHEKKAQEWIAKAEKTLNASGFMANLFGGGANQRYEDASEYYGKAANMFKLAKNWEAAGDAFIKAADCHLKVKEKYDAAAQCVKAGNCYKKSNRTAAIQALRRAVEYFTDEGRFTSAAKQQKDIAEILENEGDLEGAMNAYETCADFYEGEGSPSAANQAFLKVAEFAAQLEQFEKAIEIYEQVGTKAVDNKLIKWSARDHFLRAGLCHLCTGDVVAARRALERYQDIDGTFSSQRECKLLESCIDATENFDVEAFTNAVSDFDSISPLDAWKTSILLKVKNNIKAPEDDLC